MVIRRHLGKTFEGDEGLLLRLAVAGDLMDGFQVEVERAALRAVLFSGQGQGAHKIAHRLLVGKTRRCVLSGLVQGFDRLPRRAGAQ